MKNLYRVLALLGVATLSSPQARAVKGGADTLLSTPPAELVRQALAEGDLRILAVPLCAAETPGVLTTATEIVGSEGGPVDVDPGCAWVLGQEGMKRVERLRLYAEEYNRLLKQEMERQGLFQLYPRDAQLFSPSGTKEEKVLARNAEATLAALFGPNAPKATGSTLWRTFEGRDSRFWVEAHLTPEEFARFPLAAWKEIALPAEALPTMHLARDTPKSAMTCFSGKVDGKPSYLFWSAETGTFHLAVKLD